MLVSQFCTQFWWGCPVQSNCQDCDLILSSLQANKLAYQCLTDAGRRHETAEWEKKNFIIHSTSKKEWASECLHQFPLSPSSTRVTWRGPERCHMCSGFVLQLGNNKLGEPTAFLASSKLSLSFVPEGDVTSSLKTAHCKPNHEKWLAYSGVVESLQDSP